MLTLRASHPTLPTIVSYIFICPSLSCYSAMSFARPLPMFSLASGDTALLPRYTPSNDWQSAGELMVPKSFPSICAGARKRLSELQKPENGAARRAAMLMRMERLHQ